MARTFGTYNPAVPLGVTWEETLQLTDAADDPIDLTGYGAQAQLRDELPVVDDGDAPPPVLELTTLGYYDAPAGYVVEAITIPSPTDGRILIRVSVADLVLASPTNAKRKLRWELRLVNDDGYAIPVVGGKVVFLPACSL